jgi:Lrp/AsnC family leucine-responsive transcriptional regulator
MEKLDLKNRKILYELDLNCRQSNAQIGRKINLSKRVVMYRIKKMQEMGIIKNFWTAIDTFRLGYNVLRIYITFQYMISPDIKNKIIQHFVDYKNSWVVATDKGDVNLTIIIWVNNNYEFYKFWNKTLDLYEDYFSNVTISLYIQAIDYKKSYLLPEGHETSTREHYRITCTRNKVDIDEVDYKLLNELAVNARVPLIKLAEKLGCSSQDVKYRINNLIKKDIIKAFRVHLDYSKLNLRHFKVDIYLKKHKMLTSIVNYLKKKPFLQCLNVAIGWADIEPEFVVKSVDRLTEIVDELNVKFPDSIRKFNYWIPEKCHKERWLPEYSTEF